MDVAALIVLGLLSLFGVLIWRVVWTREVPKTLWNAERGWRLRLVLALDQGAPLVGWGPALFVWVWSAFLFVLAKKLEADRASTVLGIVVLVMFVHYWLVYLFGWPRLLIPPYARRRGILTRRSRLR